MATTPRSDDEREALIRIIYSTPTPVRGVMPMSTWPFPAAVTELADAVLAAGYRKHPEPETTKAAQAVIDAHMRGVAHRVMDVFENADDDALAEDVMQDVFAAVGILAAFRVPVGEGEQ